MGFMVAALPYIGMAASALGGVAGAVGAAQSASAQHDAAQYQAQVAENNAQIAKQQSQQAAAAGEAKAEQEALKNRAQAGAIKAAQAASNIDVNSGSAIDVRTSQEKIGQLDTQTTLSNAALQTYGYQTQAASDAGQSQLDKQQASQASAAGVLGVMSSLLSGASGVASQYAGWQRVGGGAAGAAPGFPAGIQTAADVTGVPNSQQKAYF